jgi:predicted negative regulator of RcsB-dependent stress response
MATVSQLTHDSALETSFFWDQYKIPIIIAVIVLLLGGLGFAGYQAYSHHRGSEAAAQLAAARTPQEFQQVIDRYSGTDAAASAYLLLAEQQRNEKKYTDANATFHKFIDAFPKHELVTTAWMGVAANLISLGKNDEALSTYQRLVAEYPQSFNAPLALLAEVPLLKANGRTDEARRACETIISQYRQSIVVSEALRELQQLPMPAAPVPKSQPSPAKK